MMVGKSGGTIANYVIMNMLACFWEVRASCAANKPYATWGASVPPLSTGTERPMH
jgi:hypothetical protein